jgi:hypothetical protein
MALNGKYISLTSIINSVYRDYGFNVDIDIADAYEWAGEALELIGSPSLLVDKITDGNKDLCHPDPIEIKKGRGELPCDLVYVMSVREYYSKQPMIGSTDVFKSVDYGKIGDGKRRYISEFDGSDVINSNLITNSPVPSKLEYKLNNNHIFTNFDSGLVEISYKGFLIDEDGSPMIPDNVKVRNAIKSYIAERIAFKMVIQGKMDAGRYNLISQERAWYIGAATTAANMPSVDQLESWKRAFLRLIPNINRHNSSFKNLNNQERRNNNPHGKGF